MKGLFKEVSFPQYFMYSFQEDITRLNKRQKPELERTEQASEPDILEFSDQEFKMTMSNIQRVLIHKVDNM